MKEHEITENVIGDAIKVHTALGLGLLESAYEKCLAYELKEAGLNFKQQPEMPRVYREIKLETGYRMDLWIEDKVVVEVKAVEELNEIHLA
jgi:GxxExxY protein